MNIVYKSYLKINSLILLPECTYFISRDKLCHVAFTGTMLAGGRYRRFIHWWCNRQCMSLQLQGLFCIRILLMAVSIVARAHPIILSSHFYNSTPPGRSGYHTTTIHWQNWNWLLFVHSLSGDLNVEFVIRPNHGQFLVPISYGYFAFIYWGSSFGKNRQKVFDLFSTLLPWPFSLSGHS